LITLSTDPLNLEMPFSALRTFITPREEFYVRCHFPIPALKLEDWSLVIDGAVNTPLELRYDDLRAMDQHTITATLECAGNSRSTLEPKVSGIPWGPGAVGNASWTGVSLSDILGRAGVHADAIEVVLEGGDVGVLVEDTDTAEKTSFARSIPLDKALRDTILAYDMNGEPLSPTHGFPMRAIVPGWYAMASVKWLRRITVTTLPFTGYFQSLDYTFLDRSSGEVARAPLTRQQVKSQVANPVAGETVASESAYRIHGAAWSGESTIEVVELSFDAGQHWDRATLLGQSVRNAWRLWEYEWRTPSIPSRLTLMTRATDSRGHVQPADSDPDRGAYMINHTVPTTIEVR
jgi:DMSO/TMAO reductase YedYZ molybdopterin-dependent catalytic subunit